MARKQMLSRVRPESVAEVDALLGRLGRSYLWESYPALYARTMGYELRGRFSARELSLMLDACSSLYLTPGLAGQHLIAEITDAVRLDDLASKWDVDGEELLRKIGGLSVWQAHVLEIWCARFWSAENEMEKYVKELV